MSNLSNLRSRGIQTTDREGNVFNSKKEMCAFYGINTYTFNYRKSKGLPLSTCLSKGRVQGDFVFDKKTYKGKELPAPLSPKIKKTVCVRKTIAGERITGLANLRIVGDEVVYSRGRYERTFCIFRRKHTILSFLAREIEKELPEEKEIIKILELEYNE